MFNARKGPLARASTWRAETGLHYEREEEDFTIPA